MAEQRLTSVESHLAPVGEALQAIEAEKALLGAVLYEPEAFLELASILNASDFVLPQHRKIWEAYQRLYTRQQVIDPVTVAEELERMGVLEEVGGPPYLAHLMQQVPSALHAQAYAQEVEEKSLRRAMIAVAQHMVQLAHKQDVPVDQLLAEVEREIFGILSRRSRREILPLHVVLQRYYEHLTKLAQTRELVGVPTGFRHLDALLKGMRPDELLFVAGRPGMGKTAFLLTVARHAAMQGHRLAVFSLEMSAEQVAQRLLAQEAGIPSSRLRLPQYLNSDEWRLLGEALARLAEYPIFIDDTPSLTPLQLRAKCRRIQAEHGLDLVILDYIQLMTAGVRTENRVQEVSYISRMLKLLARDLNVPVLAAAQLSRAAEHRPDKRPQLSDLRESGSLEQDADVVMFLFRPEVYSEEGKNQKGKNARTQNTQQFKPEFAGYTELIIAKNRHGPTGKVQLRFLKEQSTFVNPPTLSSEEAVSEEIPV